MEDNSEQVADNSENTEQLAITDENVPPKRRGRPAGSKGKAPRRTKTVIVETREPSPPRESATPAAAASQPSAPPSRRTVFAEATRHMATLHQERETARRAYWMSAIEKSLR